MKKFAYILLAASLTLCGCVSMDMTPKSQGNSASWYSTETELDMAVNEFYVLGYWDYLSSSERWTDNNTYRNINYNTPILDGNVNGDTWDCYHIWEQCYKLISRANALLDNIHRAEEIGVNAEKLNRYRAEAYFARACKYGDLIFLFGDVPYIDKFQTIEEAEQNGRVDKTEILGKVYEELDFAAEHLPASYTGASTHFTKGAALAMKARYALYMGDWDTAAKAAAACMKLGYSLEKDYSTIFLEETRQIPEKIFVIPRSETAKVVLDTWVVRNAIPRNAGGYAAYTPSWDLLAAYLCTDGLPIDESPLFDSKNPFANRDPRCTKTIVEFGTGHMGFIYDPSPAATKTTKLADNTQVTNNDSRIVHEYASFNGLVLKKGVSESWLENFPDGNDTDFVLMRYADVLLMYAEAKIELGEIDASVLNAINSVRSRAYGVSVTDTNFYPAVTSTDQAALRKAVRIERRMELAYENLRYADLIRWRLAGKVLNLSNYINLDPQACLDNVVNKGYWFWGITPEIDEDGVADFSALFNANLCQKGAQRVFPDRQYLMPLPSHDIELSGGHLTNNPDY